MEILRNILEITLNEEIMNDLIFNEDIKQYEIKTGPENQKTKKFI